MGWFVILKTDREVLEQDIDEIIQHLPVGLKGFFGGMKQSWGWSAGADIRIQNKTDVYLGGSYGISGKIAEPISSHFKEELEKRQYHVNREDHW